MEDKILLSFDFGRQRIGVAVGQTFTKTASPLKENIQVNSDKSHWDLIAKIIKQWRPQLIIVGYPLNMDDSAGKIAKAAKNFARELETRYHLPVTLVDERLSTREAKQRLLEKNGHDRYSKTELNNVAAQVILETWLNELDDRYI